MRYGRTGQADQTLGEEISAVKEEQLTSSLHFEKANKLGVYCVKTSRIMVKMCCPSSDISLKSTNAFNPRRTIGNISSLPLF